MRAAKAGDSAVLALTLGSMAAALVGGILPFFPAVAGLSVFLLSFATLLLMGAAYSQGAAPVTLDFSAESDYARFRRELRLNGYAVLLFVLFSLMLLFEALAVLAAMGLFRLFGPFSRGFIDYYPLVLAVFLMTFAGAVLVVRKAPSDLTLGPHRRAMSFGALGTTAFFVLVTLLLASGSFDDMGLGSIRSERAIFVLTASTMALFYFIRWWLRVPDFRSVSNWMESEDKVATTGLPRVIVLVLVSVASLLMVGSLLASAGVLPSQFAIFGLGLATLLLMGCAHSLSTRYVRTDLEDGLDHVEELQARRRLILRGVTFSLTFMGTGLAALTLLSVMAQAGKMPFLEGLLTFFVRNYPWILTLALVPLAAACVGRLYVKTDVRYDDTRKAVTMLGSTMALVLVFLGMFVGSGLARGQGIALENAVLTMSSGVVAAVVVVLARGLYPSVINIAKDTVNRSVGADKITEDNIRRNMTVTYMVALVFFLSSSVFVVLTSLNVVSIPAGVGSDLVLFVYILVGLALLGLVLVRYYQGVNIDPRATATQSQKEAIGKKRMSIQEVNRFLVLGVSIAGATIMTVIGVLVLKGVLTSLGPLQLNSSYSTDFFVFALLLGVGPYGYYHAKEVQRIKAIDSKFPEFLRDLAESQRAGMTLTEALITASKGNYGALTGEIRKMAAQIEWGISFTDALTRFSHRVKTPLIERTVTLIVEAANSGGNVVDVISAAADDSREIQMILKERKGAMGIYMMIIYVSFFVFVGVVAVLTKQFIPEVAKAVKSAAADGPVTVGGMTFSMVDEQAFKTLFFHAAVIQGFGGGLVAGVMQEGKAVAGLKHAFTMVIMSYVLFRFVIGG